MPEEELFSRTHVPAKHALGLDPRVASGSPTRTCVNSGAFMHENDYSDWSAGHGQFAMVLTQQRGDDR
jgi:hypothetical protein